MRFVRRTRAAVGGMMLLLCIGCGTNGPTTHEVTGTITFDGQPVEGGEIIFRSAKGNEKSWAGRITGGRYRLRSTAGKKRVEITAASEMHSTSKSASGEPELVRQTSIPAQYNTQSRLSAEVTPASPNAFDFHLTP